MKKNYRNLELICENISILYEDGISITDAINLLNEIDLNKNYKESIFDIEEAVLKGNSLHDAFGLYRDLYPTLFIGFISIGETNGKLAKILKSLGRYYSKRRIVQNKLISSISYPIFLLIFLLVLSLLATIFFIPIICDVLKSMGSKIPITIEFICKMRNDFSKHPIISISYLVCYFMIIPTIVIYTLHKRIDINKFSLKFKFIRLYYESILISILSIISESQINLSEGINNCYLSFDEKILKAELKHINNKLLEGNELSDVLADCSFMSKSTISMIIIGEKGGSVNNMLVKLETRLNEEFINGIEKILKRVQPTMILFLSFIVIVFIVTFILPIFNAMYSI